ncbi:MAG: tripartite tricarboxylate transporter permease [Alphaproteobacteria bacterium]
MFEGIAPALAALAHSQVMGFVILGSLIGLVAGILPGLGNIQAMAVALPFTFGMDQLTAIYFLSAICASATYGGAIPAILVNIPGTPANAATTIEGYPMAKRGEGTRALSISATASALGGLIGIVSLIVSIPIVKPVVLFFGPPETFMLVLLGMVTIAYAVQQNIIRGLATAGIGVLLSLVGYSSVTGVFRFPLGSSQYLWDGIPDVAFLTGIFGLSEAIRSGMQARKGVPAAEIEEVGFKGAWQGVKDVFHYPWTLIRSSVTGIVVGIAPGVGGSVSNVVAYAMTAQISKDPMIGKGSIEGLIAAESSNNATYGGDAVPTLAFGIPGSAAMAVLMAGFTLHGIPVGPWLMKEHMEIVWVVVFGLVAGTLFSCLVGFLVARWLARITTMPMGLVVPVIVMLILAGSFAVRQNYWDVLVTILSGIFGFFLVSHGYSLLPVIIGFLLAGSAELAFIQSLYISEGSPLIFFKSPVALILMLSAIAVGLYPILKSRLLEKERRNEKAA